MHRMNTEAQSNLISTVMLYVLLAVGAYLGLNYLAPLVADALRPSITPAKVKVSL